MPDAFIIGAGPAGCVAGICLARAGWDVSIVEQHSFPRHKVCGECVSPLGIDVLGSVGVKVDAVRLSRATLVATDGAEATIELSREMWGISRWALDAALLARAQETGVKVIVPARCERIAQGEVVLRNLRSNVMERRRVSHVIVADGKGSRGRPTGDLGVKAHFEDVVDDARAITLMCLDGHYVGLAPVEGRRWNLAMSVPARKVREVGGNLDALFERLLAENVGLARRMRRARRVGDWLASALPRYPVRSQWTPGVIPVGNAAAALEPIGGEGMGLAMRSAEIAAEMMVEGEASVARLRRAYAKLWNLRRVACRAAAVATSNPAIGSAAVSLLNANSTIGRAMLALTGKPVAQGM